MDAAINARMYPIRKVWLLKYPLTLGVIFVPLIIFFSFVDYYRFLLYSAVCVVFIIYNVISCALQILCFSYRFDEKFLHIKQGILRKQERNIPYGVIQNIIIQSSVFDRIFGLSSISILNASQGSELVDDMGNTTKTVFGMRVATRKNRTQIEMIGFTGNKVHIPGLRPADTETLKLALLKKMKEYEAADTGSGL